MDLEWILCQPVISLLHKVQSVQLCCLYLNAEINYYKTCTALIDVVMEIIITAVLLTRMCGGKMTQSVWSSQSLGPGCIVTFTHVSCEIH